MTLTQQGHMPFCPVPPPRANLGRARACDVTAIGPGWLTGSGRRHTCQSVWSHCVMLITSPISTSHALPVRCSLGVVTRGLSRLDRVVLEVRG